MQAKMVIQRILLIACIALFAFTTVNYTLTYLGNTAENGQYKYYLPKKGANDTLTVKADLSSYILKAGDTMTGTLVVNKGIRTNAGTPSTAMGAGAGTGASVA